MAQRQFRSDDTSRWLERFGNGSDGALTISADTTDSPVDATCTGTSGTTSLSATNASFSSGKIIIIHQTRGTGAGNWELNKISSYTAGTITTAYPLINTYASGAQVIQIKQYSSVTVDANKAYYPKAFDGTFGGILAILCNGSVTVNGYIAALGASGGSMTQTSGSQHGPNIVNTGGFRGGSGSTTTVTDGSNSASGGEDAYQNADTRYNDSGGTPGGGGGRRWTAGDGQAGAGGGNGTAGSNGLTAGGPGGGVGGSTCGTSALTTILFGGGGGGGINDTNSGEQTGAGGNGGGIVIIIAPQIIVSSATTGISANGGNGGASNGGEHSCGGGGAGGSILLKCHSATLGTGKVFASGGAGGSNASSKRGGDGGDGRIHIDYSGSVSGTTTPTVDLSKDAIFSGAILGFII